jgi:hypothetical protein
MAACCCSIRPTRNRRPTIRCSRCAAAMGSRDVQNIADILVDPEGSLEAEPLGEDQPCPAGRRDPACPLCRGRQDIGRRRRLPVRSEAPDRVDAAAMMKTAISARGRIPSSPAPRASCSTNPTTSARACCRPPCRFSASTAIPSSPR